MAVGEYSSICCRIVRATFRGSAFFPQVNTSMASHPMSEYEWAVTWLSSMRQTDVKPGGEAPGVSGSCTHCRCTWFIPCSLIAPLMTSSSHVPPAVASTQAKAVNVEAVKVHRHMCAMEVARDS